MTATTTVDGDARAEWLDWRRHGIGGSDIAGILGISPWASPWSVWADKVGLTRDTDDNELFEFGRWAELMLGPWFAHRTGLHVACEQERCTHPDHPWARVTLDGRVYESPNSSDALGVLEEKTSGPGPRWDDIPAHYQAQVGWQLFVTGAPHAWVVRLAGRRLDVHELTRDDDDIRFMAERAEAFWHDHVLAGVPPAVDGSDATLRAISEVWPEHTPGTGVELDHQARAALDLLADAKAAAKEAKAGENLAKATLAAALGDAEEGLVDGRRAVTYRAQTRTTRCSHCGHADTSDPFRVLRPVTPKEPQR